MEPLSNAPADPQPDWGRLLPRDAFAGIFAAARVIGWVAHALEQTTEARLIRPQSRYIGPMLTAI